MQNILIAGGNSGIGLQAARSLAADGHRLLLLGRDPAKGEAAVNSLGGKAEFMAADLSTHAGVRAAAGRIGAEYGRIDTLVHTTGILTAQESRTPDGLHPFFAVNYLSRYHLTQLLLPALTESARPVVLMMTAAIPPTDGTDFSRFPRFENFDFARDRKPVQLGNHHYAAHLADKGIAAGVVNAGAAKTGILRAAPWYMRAGAKVAGPLMFDSVERCAHNVVEAVRRDDWQGPLYWGGPGRFEERVPIGLDATVTKQLLSASRELTGV